MHMYCNVADRGDDFIPVARAAAQHARLPYMHCVMPRYRIAIGRDYIPLNQNHR